MIFQHMFTKLLKAGSIIPEDSISTTKNMSKSKKNEGLMPSFFCIKLALKDSVPDSDAQVLKEAFESDPSLVDLGVEF